MTHYQNNNIRRSNNSSADVVRKYSQPQELEAFKKYSQLGLEKYEKNIFSSLIKKNDFVLDLGCGAGREAKPIANMCARVYALDIVKGMLVSAKSIVDANNIYFICADLKHLPICNSSIDVVIMTKQLLNHLTTLENRKIAMEEVYRVLKPGGRVFITIHNNLFNIGIIHILNGIYKIMHRVHTTDQRDNKPIEQGKSTNLLGIATGLFLLKIRSLFVNNYRRIISKISKDYKGKEIGDWEISQVSYALSPYKSPYHNFTFKEITSFVLNAGFIIQDIRDTWELSNNRSLPGFLRKGAYTLALILKKEAVIN